VTSFTATGVGTASYTETKWAIQSSYPTGPTSDSVSFETPTNDGSYNGQTQILPAVMYLNVDHLNISYPSWATSPGAGNYAFLNTWVWGPIAYPARTTTVVAPGINSMSFTDVGPTEPNTQHVIPNANGITLTYYVPPGGYLKIEW
jgi:hypothetical protein